MVRFADAAIEASDGTVYFSDASTRFGFDRWFLACLESRHTGRLLKYDPRTGKTSVMLDNLAFANGVALPRDEAFVIVCESAGYSTHSHAPPPPRDHYSVCRQQITQFSGSTR
jgi:sugar lactone lactonase YvrE